MRFSPILLCAGLLLAQTKPAAQDTCRVEGEVRNFLTSLPVFRARVTLLRVSSPQLPAAPGAPAPPRAVSAVTDAEGKFAFAGVAGGGYQIEAQKDNFKYSYARLALTAGEEKKSIVLQITPFGVITGHVRNQEGEAIQNVQVNAMAYQYTAGVRQLVTLKGAPTNDLGEYRVFGLERGKYFIAAEPVLDQGADEAYLAMYYPGADDPSGAAPADLDAGQELRIDFTLRRTHPVTVRGRVVKVIGASSATVVNLFNDQGQSISSLANQDGNFVLRGVVPSTYTLMGQARVGDKSYRARRPLQVGADDIEGVEIRLAPPVDLNGVVRIEGNTSAKPSRVEVGIRMNGTASVKDDGTFAFSNLTPDIYRPNVVAPGDLFVKSMQCGDTDVLEFGLDLRSGTCDFVITLRTNGGQIEGRVDDENAQPAKAATVTLVAEGTQRTDLFKVTSSDASGIFRIVGLAPGRYRLYAWEAVDPNAVRYDPDFVKPFASYARSLQIDEGARESVSLKQIAKPAEK